MFLFVGHCCRTLSHAAVFLYFQFSSNKYCWDNTVYYTWIVSLLQQLFSSDLYTNNLLVQLSPFSCPVVGKYSAILQHSTLVQQVNNTRRNYNYLVNNLLYWPPTKNSWLEINLNSWVLYTPIKNWLYSEGAGLYSYTHTFTAHYHHVTKPHCGYDQHANLDFYCDTVISEQLGHDQLCSYIYGYIQLAVM